MRIPSYWTCTGEGADRTWTMTHISGEALEIRRRLTGKETWVYQGFHGGIKLPLTDTSTVSFTAALTERWADEHLIIAGGN